MFKMFYYLFLFTIFYKRSHAQYMPIAKHQLVVVNPGGDSVIRLQSYETNSFNVSYKIISAPTSGSLYQLSQVYSNYGYEPKAGTKIYNQQPVVVTGSNNRVYYRRPNPDTNQNNKWDSFDFIVIDPEGIPNYPASYVNVISEFGRITLVPPSGAIVSSGFLLNTEDWIITGNKATISKSSTTLSSSNTGVTFESYSRGPFLNRYIIGTDDLINVQNSGDSDSSLWYFVAPSKFYGNYGIAYGGNLQFTIGSFSGDLTKLNDLNTYVVLLECASCDGPVGKGITLGYTLASLINSPNIWFKNQAMQVKIPLKETVSKGWVKDPQNTLLSWSSASQCDVIQVLSRLTKISILGDYTTWYETMALDDVLISNTKGQLPLCAQNKPDASICTC